jgi:hypothetical protein
VLRKRDKAKRGVLMTQDQSSLSPLIRSGTPGSASAKIKTHNQQKVDAAMAKV